MLLKLEFLIVWVLKRVAIKSVKKNLLKNIKQGNQVGEDEGLLLYCSNIYVPNTVNLFRRVVTFYYNLKVARHPNR